MPSRSITEKCVVSSGSGAVPAVTMSLPSSTLLDAFAGSIVDAADLRVLLRRQPRDRHLDEVGIAEMARAIEVGAAHRFDLQVQRRRGQQALRP